MNQTAIYMSSLFSLVKLFMRIDHRLKVIAEILHSIAERSAPHQQSAADEWLDNQDVMQLLKISDSTLKRYRLQGIIPSTRIKGKPYYKRSEICEILASQRNK
jgi:hypothetical protein